MIHEPESCGEDNQLSRASFLTQLGRVAAAFAFGAPPVCMALSTKIEHKIKDDSDIPLEAGDYFDVEVSSNSLPDFRIIGTTHTDENYKVLKPYLHDVVKESDIILYEEAIRPDQFFNLVAKEAKDQGKRTFPIDSANPWVRATWCGIANGAGFAVAAHEIMNLVKRDNSPELTRRQLIGKGLVRAAILSQVFEGPLTYVTKASDYYYPHRDISYVVDGRTVFMLHNILEIVKESNGEKITAVVGGMHARGFIYYLSTPERKAEFEKRLSIYSKTPWRLISRMPPEI